MKFSTFFKALGLNLLIVAGCLTHSFATTHVINFSGTSFTPNILDVAVGDTIVWNGSFGFHEIQSTQGGIPPNAPPFGPSSSSATVFSYVVTLPGTYAYQCNFHISMGMVGTFTAVAADVGERPLNGFASLEKNFPNPLSEKTTIPYTLSRAAHVKLSVFDIQGKEVGSPVSKFQDAGNYELSFDGSSLAGGTYIYQLQAGDAILTRQMIVLKR